MDEKLTYIAFFHTEDGPSVGVTFPDFPGCVSAGDDMDDARRMAEEALAFHIESIIEDGDELPEPSAMDDIAGQIEDPVHTVLVSISVADPRKRERINLSVTASELSRIDERARASGMNRSSFMVRSALTGEFISPRKAGRKSSAKKRA